MSFSGTVKEELSRQISTARHCRIAETAALLSLCGRFTADGALRMQTENSAVIRKYFTLVQKTFNIETEIAVRENRQMKKGHIYYVEIKDDALIRTVLLGTKLSREQNSGGDACFKQQSAHSADMLQKGVYPGSFSCLRFHQ